MVSRNRSRLGLVSAVVAAVGLVVTACSTNNVLSLRPDVDVGTETASLPGTMVETAGMQMVAPVEMPPEMPPEMPAEQAMDPASEEPYLAAYPQPDNPASEPGMEPDVQAVEPDNEPYQEPYVQQSPAAMPADEVACRKQLDRMDVAYVELDPIDDGGECQIDHPIKVSAIGRVKMQPAATLRCEMAATVAAWTKKELIPSARTRYLSGVKTIHQASSYSCRKIARSRTMSEHAKGNALDISRIELNSGRDIEIEKPGLFAFRTRGLLNNVRSDACEYFSTVLGPGYNYDHRNHFHFDIKPRRKTSCH